MSEIKTRGSQIPLTYSSRANALLPDIRTNTSRKSMDDRINASSSTIQQSYYEARQSIVMMLRMMFGVTRTTNSIYRARHKGRAVKRNSQSPPCRDRSTLTIDSKSGIVARWRDVKEKFDRHAIAPIEMSGELQVNQRGEKEGEEQMLQMQ